MIRPRLYGHSNSLSAFELSQRIPVLDAATDECIGYLSAEYLNTRARDGFLFFSGSKLWKILHIAQDETVYVLLLDAPGMLVRHFAPELPVVTHEVAQDIGRMSLTRGIRSDNSLNRVANPRAKRYHAREAEVKRIIEELRANALRGLPTPTDKLIILEAFENYLVLHTLFGDSVNATLSLIFEAILTEEDLVRGVSNDGFRILIHTPIKLTKEELESISTDLFQLDSKELKEFLQKAFEARFPKLRNETRRSIIESKNYATFREEFTSKPILRRVGAIFDAIADGKIEIRIFMSRYRATPLANSIINEHAKRVSNEMQSLIQSNSFRLKKTLERERIELFCLNCSTTQQALRIKGLDARPICSQCGSGLLALIEASNQSVGNLLARKKAGKSLTQVESARLARARRTADLVLSYGKRAAIALTVKGIGPQTASTILAKMESDESLFYSDLLKAKVHYLQTREIWDSNPVHSDL